MLRGGGGGIGEAKEAGALASAAEEKARKTRKALIEKLALAQEVQRLVMGKRIRPLLITEVRGGKRAYVWEFPSKCRARALSVALARSHGNAQ